MAALLVVLGVVGRAMDLGNAESSTVEAGAESGGGPEPLVSVSFTLTPGGGGEPEIKSVDVLPGSDTAAAAWKFSLENNLDPKSLISIKKTIDSNAHKEGVQDDVVRHHKQLPKDGPSVLVAKAKKMLQSGKFNSSAEFLLRAFHPQEVARAALPEESDDVYQLIDSMKDGVLTHRKLMDALKDENHDAAMEHGKQLLKIAPKAGHIHLTIARSLETKQLWSKVLQSCTKCLQACGTRGQWSESQDRAQCVLLGAHAALELGDINSANKRMSVVLRSDPDAQFIKPLYNKLKAVRKRWKKVDWDLEKGYNHRAIEGLEDILKNIESMNLTQPILKGKVQLLVCKGLARIKKHEDALVVCDEAIELAGMVKEVEGLFLDPAKLADAYRARAEAYMADHDYSEAVRDFRQVVEHEANGDAKRKAEDDLRNAKWKEKEWEENRDHQKVLQLPVNFDTLNAQSKCAWIRKQHKKMVRKWHPDKRRKGNKKRAERKFAEVAEANKMLTKELGCKGRGRGGGGRRRNRRRL